MKKNTLYNFFLVQQSLLQTILLLSFCFVQISLNFLSFFFISQPYVMVIFLFLLIMRSDNPPSSLLLVFTGFFYDLITGTHLGIHSFFFILVKNLIFFYEERYKISKFYGEWILFSIVYSLTLIITKIIFIFVNFTLPDLNAISFNLGFTLLIFPIISFLIDLPKYFLSFVLR